MAARFPDPVARATGGEKVVFILAAAVGIMVCSNSFASPSAMIK